MIKLHQYQPSWGLPNASPFCLKLETYLRMAKIPFECTHHAHPRKAPKGKLPYIEDKDQKVADSNLIIEYLKSSYGDTLDRHLSAQQKAAGLGMRRMIEENLYWCLVYSRWFDERGWVNVKKEFFGSLPPVLRKIIPELVKKSLWRQLQGQGMGRHNRVEIYKIGMADLSALSDFLDSKMFFLGDRPTTLDATAYGFLANILWAPIRSPLKEWTQKQPNLVDYCIRMRDKFFLNVEDRQLSLLLPESESDASSMELDLFDNKKTARL
jgi:glutathione S-transferase